MDFEVVSRELIRALRGKTSQRALSRRLGYSSNVLYTWEAGCRAPSAAELLRLVALRRHLVPEMLTAFARTGASEIHGEEGAALVAAFLRVLQGNTSIKDLAESAGASRYQIMRWLSGRSEPKAADFLRFIEATTIRVLDFIALLVEPALLPSVCDHWHELEARRRIAVEHPWSQAILRAMELASYREAQDHRPGWVAHTVGISMQEEAQCIEALEHSGLVRWNGRRYELTEATVDTSLAPTKARQNLKRHWLGVAQEHLENNSNGLYSYNLMSMSHNDLARLRELHVEYFQTVRSIVVNSEPECVALIAMQLFELGDASG